MLGDYQYRPCCRPSRRWNHLVLHDERRGDCGSSAAAIARRLVSHLRRLRWRLRYARPAPVRERGSELSDGCESNERHGRRAADGTSLARRSAVGHPHHAVALGRICALPELLGLHRRRSPAAATHALALSHVRSAVLHRLPHGLRRSWRACSVCGLPCGPRVLSDSKGPLPNAGVCWCTHGAALALEATGLASPMMPEQRSTEYKTCLAARDRSRRNLRLAFATAFA